MKVVAIVLLAAFAVVVLISHVQFWGRFLREVRNGSARFHDTDGGDNR